MSLLQLKLLSIHLSTHLFIHLPIYLSALYFKSMDLSVQSLWGTDSIGIIWSFILKVCLVLWPHVISLASSLTTSCSFHWPSVQFSSAQLLSSVRLFATPWITAHQASLSIHHQLPEFTQTHVHQVHDAIQPSHPLSSPSPPALNPSQHL